MNEKEHERRMVFARQEAAKAWGASKTSNRTMDTNLAEEFARILVGHMYAPHLGCSKTSELQAEIDARDGREEATIYAGD